MKKCQFSWIGKFLLNKRDFRADGLPLQPPALRPRLLGVQESEKRDEIKFNRGRIRLNVVKIVVMTTILGIFGLFSMNFATPVSAASLTLSVPTGALKIDLQPNNTFAKSSASSVSVKTNAFAGYTLSIKAKSSNDLVNGSNKISSISSNLTEDQYKASGNTNTWGYQPSKFNNNSNSAFLPGPTTSPSTIEKTSAKNDTANTYSFVIGSKVDNTIPKGTYSNTFVFTATANTVSYNITYNLNSGTWNGKSPQTGNTAESIVTLDSYAPSRTDYSFKGWCTRQTNSEICPGDIKSPGSSINLNNSDNNIFTLYAIWEGQSGEDVFSAVGKVKYKNYYKMQDMTNELCAKITKPSANSTMTLIDSRDDNLYTVAKLLDDKCWMTQNLKIAGKTLSTSDSDVGANFVLPSSISAGFESYTSSNVHIDSTGGYYNWFAATAGEGTSSKTTGDVNHSICPKNWHLPTSNDFNTLVSKYRYEEANKPPLNFTLSGFYHENSLNNNGLVGNWWSSTAYSEDASRAHALYLNPAYVSFGPGYDYRSLGFQIRCMTK